MKAVTLGQCNLKIGRYSHLRVWSVRSVNGKGEACEECEAAIDCGTPPISKSVIDSGAQLLVRGSR